MTKTNEMTVELRRLDINHRMSQETIAFTADVWVDGNKAGFARNDGNGGCTIVKIAPALRNAVEAYGKTLVPDEYKRFVSGTEWIVDQIINSAVASQAVAP